ncbi:unnamed protein product [Mucor circinelloides]
MLGNTRNLVKHLQHLLKRPANLIGHQPQQQQTQREQIAFEESTSGSSYPPPPPGDQAETNLAQVNADFQDLQTTSKDPDLDDDEDDEGDDEYMPSASEGESGVEDMSDLESDKDEVADLHQQQQQDVNIFTNGAVYGDSNTHTTPSSAYSMKASHPQTQSSYLRYLRLQQFNIILLQETHVSANTITSIELQLQAQQYLWTYYCGIASFSPEYILTKIATNHLYDSERYILCKVHHPHNFYEPFYILNLYAPASSNNKPTREFFHSIYALLSAISDTVDLDRLIISGDFNYDYERDINNTHRILKTSLDWLGYLDQHFYNCMLHNNMHTISTYQHALSTIDYVFAGSSLRHFVKDAAVGFIPAPWSDHAILEVNFKLGNSKLGPGLWRGNPAYANNLALSGKIGNENPQHYGKHGHQHFPSRTMGND